MPLEEVIAEAMIRATTAPPEAGDDAVKNAREDDGTLWHFARLQARVAIGICAKDAERYRWLRDNGHIKFLCRGKEVDDFVDAEMAKPPVHLEI